MTIKGFYTKLKDITNAQIEHVTVSEASGDKVALDVNIVSGAVGGGGSGTSDTTAANQATQIAEAQDTNTKLDQIITNTATTGGGGGTSDTTAANQATIIARLDSLLAQDDIPAHTHQRYTFVNAGNGIGEIETISYYSGTTASEVLEQTRTFTYDASNRVILMEKS